MRCGVGGCVGVNVFEPVNILLVRAACFPEQADFGATPAIEFHTGRFKGLMDL